MSARLRLHVIPIGNGEPWHIAAKTCFCSPSTKRIPDADEVFFVPETVAHNASDGRERFEPHGVKLAQDSHWITVAEEVRD